MAREKLSEELSRLSAEQHRFDWMGAEPDLLLEVLQMIVREGWSFTISAVGYGTVCRATVRDIDGNAAGWTISDGVDLTSWLKGVRAVGGVEYVRTKMEPYKRPQRRR